VTTRLDGDELAVPHFKERLWRELEELHGSTAAAGTVAPARAARRPRLLAAAAVVAVGGAAAGMVVLGGRDEPATIAGPGGQPATPAEATTTEPTTTETTRPLGIVMVEHRNAAGHVLRRWKDERTGLWRELAIGADGNPTSDSGYTSRRQVGDEVVITTRQVDHCTREYQDGELRLPIETVRAAMPENQRVGDIPDTVFDDGSLIADGTEVVDGRELLRYRDDANDGVVWLDPDTREIVRRRFSAGTDAEQAEVYEYLARTPENLAVLVPEVPPGFTTPPTADADAARTDTGCA
jgi:hypothetical protein